jgi:hypothetical protein
MSPRASRPAARRRAAKGPRPAGARAARPRTKSPPAAPAPAARRSRTAPGSGALPGATRDVLGPIAVTAAIHAPGRVRTETDPRGWGRVVVSGPGRRRLPGGREDTREHVVTAAYDGTFLQLTYRVAGRLVDSLFLAGPKRSDVAATEAFLERHASRIAPA